MATATALPTDVRPAADDQRPSTLRARLWARPGGRVALILVALLILVAILAPALAALEGQDPNTYHDALLNSATGGGPNGPFGGISTAHWLGVEPTTGRDVFARLVYGSRISLLVAGGATLGQLLLGLLVGLAAGLGNRWVDGLLSRFTDLALSFPFLFLAIALLAIVPQSFPRPLLLCLILAGFGWSYVARIVRAETLVLRERDFVAAARLYGASTWRIARREILPGLVAPVATYTALAGHGAHLNGRPLHVSRKTDLGLSIAATSQSVPDPSPETLKAMSKSIAAMLRDAMVVRVSVPASLHLVNVAAGSMDVFWQFAGTRADLLPGALLVAEAGGVVTDAHGAPWTTSAESFLAAGPGVHEEAVESLSGI